MFDIDPEKKYWCLMRPLYNCFGIIYTSSNDSPMWVKCYIDESRYKVKDGYKITLCPENEGYAKEDFYQTDFNSLIQQGYIVEDKGQRVVYVEEKIPLSENVFICNSGYVLAK